MRDSQQKALIASRLAKDEGKSHSPLHIANSQAETSVRELRMWSVRCGIDGFSKRLQVFDHLPLFFLTQLEAERMALIAQAGNCRVHHAPANFAGGVF